MKIRTEGLTLSMNYFLTNVFTLWLTKEKSFLKGEVTPYTLSPYTNLGSIKTIAFLIYLLIYSFHTPPSPGISHITNY